MNIKHSVLITAVMFTSIGAIVGAYALEYATAPTATPKPTVTTPLPTPDTKPTTSTDTQSFDVAKLGTTESDITYCTIDGESLLMDVHWPTSGNGPFPAVIYVHGGGWSMGSKTEGVDRHIASITEHGMALFSINYRLAGKHQFPAMIEDVKCAIRSVRANAETYAINPDAIGILGESAGGHLVALAGTADQSAGWDAVGDYQDTSSIPNAVVDMFGPTDLTVPFEGNNAEGIRRIFGITNFSAMAFASPIAYITPNDPPFLILHGEDDPLVPITQSESFFTTLINAGVDAEFVRVAHAGHSFTPTTPRTPISPGQDEIQDIVSAWLVERLQ